MTHEVTIHERIALHQRVISDLEASLAIWKKDMVRLQRQAAAELQTEPEVSK